MARKRKATVRRDSTSGRSRGEPREVMRALAEQNRVKHAGVLERDAGDPLAGFTLGVLRIRGRASQTDPSGISQEQYEAGAEWSRICRQHAVVQGYEVKAMASPSFLFIERGSGVFDPDESTVARVRERFTTCYDALMKECRIHGLVVRNATWAVCLDDSPVLGLSEADFGNLRIGLNAIARALGIGR